MYTIFRSCCLPSEYVTSPNIVRATTVRQGNGQGSVIDINFHVLMCEILWKHLQNISSVHYIYFDHFK